jgi:nitroreductase
MFSHTCPNLSKYSPIQFWLSVRRCYHAPSAAAIDWKKDKLFRNNRVVGGTALNDASDFTGSEELYKILDSNNTAHSLTQRNYQLIDTKLSEGLFAGARLKLHTKQMVLALKDKNYPFIFKIFEELRALYPTLDSDAYLPVIQAKIQSKLFTQAMQLYEEALEKSELNGFRDSAHFFSYIVVELAEQQQYQHIDKILAAAHRRPSSGAMNLLVYAELFAVLNQSIDNESNGDDWSSRAARISNLVPDLIDCDGLRHSSRKLSNLQCVRILELLQRRALPEAVVQWMDYLLADGSNFLNFLSKFFWNHVKEAADYLERAKFTAEAARFHSICAQLAQQNGFDVKKSKISDKHDYGQLLRDFRGDLPAQTIVQTIKDYSSKNENYIPYGLFVTAFKSLLAYPQFIPVSEALQLLELFRKQFNQDLDHDKASHRGVQNAAQYKTIAIQSIYNTMLNILTSKRTKSPVSPYSTREEFLTAAFDLVHEMQERDIKLTEFSLLQMIEHCSAMKPPALQTVQTLLRMWLEEYKFDYNAALIAALTRTQLYGNTQSGYEEAQKLGEIARERAIPVLADVHTSWTNYYFNLAPYPGFLTGIKYYLQRAPADFDSFAIEIMISRLIDQFHSKFPYNKEDNKLFFPVAEPNGLIQKRVTQWTGQDYLSLIHWIIQRQTKGTQLRAYSLQFHQQIIRFYIDYGHPLKLQRYYTRLHTEKISLPPSFLEKIAVAAAMNADRALAVEIFKGAFLPEARSDALGLHRAPRSLQLFRCLFEALAADSGARPLPVEQLQIIIKLHSEAVEYINSSKISQDPLLLRILAQYKANSHEAVAEHELSAILLNNLLEKYLKGLTALLMAHSPPKVNWGNSEAITLILHQLLNHAENDVSHLLAVKFNQLLAVCTHLELKNWQQHNKNHSSEPFQPLGLLQRAVQLAAKHSERPANKAALYQAIFFYETGQLQQFDEVFTVIQAENKPSRDALELQIAYFALNNNLHALRKVEENLITQFKALKTHDWLLLIQCYEAAGSLEDLKRLQANLIDLHKAKETFGLDWNVLNHLFQALLRVELAQHRRIRSAILLYDDYPELISARSCCLLLKSSILLGQMANFQSLWHDFQVKLQQDREELLEKQTKRQNPKLHKQYMEFFINGLNLAPRTVPTSLFVGYCDLSRLIAVLPAEVSGYYANSLYIDPQPERGRFLEFRECLPLPKALGFYGIKEKFEQHMHRFQHKAIQRKLQNITAQNPAVEKELQQLLALNMALNRAKFVPAILSVHEKLQGSEGLLCDALDIIISHSSCLFTQWTSDTKQQQQTNETEEEIL